MTSTDEWTNEVLPVRIENPDALAKLLLSAVQLTQEKRAAHVSCQSFVITNTGDPVQVLQEDPLRTRAVISANGVGGQVWFCHSFAQATNALKGGNPNADQGFQVAVNVTPFEYKATAALWVVPSGAGPFTIGVLQERTN